MPSDDAHVPDAASDSRQNPLSQEDSEIDWTKAQEGTRLLLEAIGESPDDPTLEDTWRRRVPAVFETLSEGKRATAKPTMRTFSTTNNQLVIKTGIPLYSLCKHHLLPYFGQIHIAYRPNDEVVGLSKLARYTRWQSRRLTMQEQLTDDIATGLRGELSAEAVLVAVDATHLCEAMRGVETHTNTATEAVVGDVTEQDRTQFYQAIEKSAE